MKKLIFLAIFISSCITPGTLIRVDRIQNPQIEVYKYFYNRNQFIYVTKMDSIDSQTINWWEDNGHSVRVRALLIIPMKN